MPLVTFLNIFAACLGFLAALFFAAGAAFTTPTKVFKTASMQWDMNEHWADTLADQRADYIAGALLLLLSFASQLLANIAPSSAEPSLLQPIGCAVAEIVALLALLLLCAILLRNAVAKSTKAKVRQLAATAEAQAELEAKSRPQQ